MSRPKLTVASIEVTEDSLGARTVVVRGVTGKKGGTLEAINLDAASHGRIRVDETSAVGEVDENGDFCIELEGRMGREAMLGDHFRFRVRDDEGTSEWFETTIPGPKERSPIVNMDRISLFAKDGEIWIENLEIRPVGGPYTEVRFLNDQNRVDATVVLDRHGMIPAGQSISGVEGNTLRVAVKDGEEYRDVGHLVCPGLARQHIIGLPVPAPHKDETNPDGTPRYSLARFRGPLFKGKFSVNDAAQGYLPDCGVVAAMGALAHCASKNPSMLDGLIRQSVGVKLASIGLAPIRENSDNLMVTADSVVGDRNRTVILTHTHTRHRIRITLDDEGRIPSGEEIVIPGRVGDRFTVSALYQQPHDVEVPFGEVTCPEPDEATDSDEEFDTDNRQDPIYLVRFKKPNWDEWKYDDVEIAVDTDFYVRPSGTALYDRTTNSTNTPEEMELYVALVIKAWFLWRYPKEGYAGTDNGIAPSLIMSHALGMKDVRIALDGDGGEKLSEERILEVLENAAAANLPVVVTTYVDEVRYVNTGFVSAHCYTVMGTLKVGDSHYAILRNGWGEDIPEDTPAIDIQVEGPGIFPYSIQGFRSRFSTIFTVSTKPPWGAGYW